MPVWSKQGRAQRQLSVHSPVCQPPASFSTSASSLNPGVFSPLNCENEVKCSGWVARHTVNKLTDQGQVAAAAASGSKLEGTSDKKEPAIWFELFPTSFYGSDFLLMNCIAWQDGGFLPFFAFSLGSLASEQFPAPGWSASPDWLSVSKSIRRSSVSTLGWVCCKFVPIALGELYGLMQPQMYELNKAYEDLRRNLDGFVV